MCKIQKPDSEKQRENGLNFWALCFGNRRSEGLERYRAGRELVLHSADLGSIPSTPLWSSEPTRNEFWVQSSVVQNKLKQKTKRSELCKVKYSTKDQRYARPNTVQMHYKELRRQGKTSNPESYGRLNFEHIPHIFAGRSYQALLYICGLQVMAISQFLAIVYHPTLYYEEH